MTTELDPDRAPMTKIYQILNGDCRELIRTLDDGSIDAIVTDPPYELIAGKKGGSGVASVNLNSPYGRARIGTGNGGGFMGKKWDATGIAHDPEFWAECLRVLKPGGHLVAFGGTRTYHRMACAIEDAGFEVRDSLHWIYGSGFPKSLDVSKAIDKAAGAERERVKGARTGGMASLNKGNAGHGYRGKPYYDDGNMMMSNEPATDDARQWQGWGTALKPAHEPIVVARKPLIGTVAANVQAHGTGALNIDGTRLVTTDNLNGGAYAKEGSERHDGAENWRFKRGGEAGSFKQPPGRWPPNVLLSHTEDCDDKCADDCPVLEMDRQSGISKSAGGRIGNSSGCYSNLGSTGWSGDHQKGDPGYGDEGGSSRFFPCFRYHPKAARKERDEGCDELPAKTGADAVGRDPESPGMDSPRAGAGRTAAAVRNHHPTVKPVELMKWLVKLVTPNQGKVLDPFTGSGTTGIACVLEGFKFIGFEQDPEYVAIATARIKSAAKKRKRD